MIFVVALGLILALPASGAGLSARQGWKVINTSHGFSALVKRLEAAIKGQKMGIVSRASASKGAKHAGIKIAGNMVIGVYRNDFARRMLKASVAAGIEAPIRFYVTENRDGTATLSYKTPSAVFAPYQAEGGKALKSIGRELDTIFARIAALAVRKK
jgi:uncharacterized protein (DUF302 family)